MDANTKRLIPDRSSEESMISLGKKRKAPTFVEEVEFQIRKLETFKRIREKREKIMAEESDKKIDEWFVSKLLFVL